MRQSCDVVGIRLTSARQRGPSRALRAVRALRTQIVVATRDGGEQIAVYGWRRYARQDLLTEWTPAGPPALVVLPSTAP